MRHTARGGRIFWASLKPWFTIRNEGYTAEGEKLTFPEATSAENKNRKLKQTTLAERVWSERDRNGEIILGGGDRRTVRDR
jgi:hypothetical protein